MPMFRKKTGVIEARRWDGSLNGAGHLCEWINGPVYDGEPTAGYVYNKDGVSDFLIATPEGDQQVDPEDWIIKDVTGEFYLCKPDIFAITYSPEPK